MTPRSPEPRSPACPRTCRASRPPPVPGLTTYKLSSNENPYPPLPGVLEEAARVAATMNRYPDMGCVALYDALARAARRRHRAASRRAPGRSRCSTTWCRRSASPATRSSTRGGPSRPTRSRSAVSGAVSVQVPVTATYEHDLDAMAAAVTDRTKVVVVCSPNNPTGPAVTPRALPRSSRRCRSHVVVVVDEAYREFVRIDDPIDGVAFTREHAERRGDADLREGLRAGRAAHPATSSPRRGRRRGARVCAAVRCLLDRAGRGRRLARPVRPSCSSASTRSSPSAPGSPLRLPEPGLALPDAQGNFVWLPLGDRTARVRRCGGGGGHHGAPVRGRRGAGEHR